MLAIGTAFDNELGGAVWFGAADRQFLGGRAEVGAAMAIGNFVQRLAIRLRGQSPRPSTPVVVVGGDLSRELLREFTPGGDVRPGLRVYQGTVTAGIERLLGRDWTAVAGLEAAAWDLPAGPGGSGAGGFFRLERDPCWTVGCFISRVS